MEFPRKTVHLLSLLVPIATYFSLFWTQIVILGFVIFYLISEWVKLKGHEHPITFFIALMQRDHEKTSFAKAPLFLAFGVLVAITFFSWKSSIVGIYMAGFCDTMAAWAGKKWGQTKIPLWSRKTLVGSGFFFLSALPVAFYFLPPSKAILVSATGAFLESLPFRDWDNLTLPIVITFLAEQFMGG